MAPNRRRGRLERVSSHCDLMGHGGIMTQDDILSRLTEIFKDIFEDPGLTLTPDTDSDMIPQWDSMSQVTLAVEIEHRFGIKVKSAEMEQMKSIRELIDLIGSRLRAFAR